MTASTALDSVLRARGVEKSFAVGGEATPVLTGVDLVIAPGEIVAVRGRSGAGKTTLLAILAGWEQPDAGMVTVLDGGPPQQQPWRDVALVPQANCLLEELTVGENVHLPQRLARQPGGDEAADLLARLGLDGLAERYPSETSRGEQQRAAVARAAILRPRLMLVDEPISHQNAAWAEATMAVLRELAAAGTSCLIASHDPLAVEAAHRVLDLRDGALHPA